MNASYNHRLLTRFPGHLIEWLYVLNSIMTPDNWAGLKQIKVEC